MSLNYTNKPEEILKESQLDRMVSVLIVGATRGLGASITKKYAASNNTVFATTRSDSGPKDFPDKIQWLKNIDLTKSSVGDDLVKQLKTLKLDVVVSAKGKEREERKKGK